MCTRVYVHIGARCMTEIVSNIIDSYKMSSFSYVRFAPPPTFHKKSDNKQQVYVKICSVKAYLKPHLQTGVLSGVSACKAAKRRWKTWSCRLVITPEQPANDNNRM